MPEYQEFARHNHFDVLHPVLRYVVIASSGSLSNSMLIFCRLLALGMELPEETFVNIHDFNETAVKYGAIL